MILVQMGLQLGVDTSELLFEQFEHRLDTFARVRMAGLQSLALGRLHAQELPAAHYDGRQQLLLGIGQRFDDLVQVVTLTEHLGQMSQAQRVDTIGLGQFAHGAGKVARLARIEYRHGHAGRLQRTGQRHLVAACGLQHNHGRAQAHDMGHHCVMACAVVGERLMRLYRPRSKLQAIFGHINTHVDRVKITHRCPSLQMRSEVHQLFGLTMKECSRAPSAWERAAMPKGETGCTRASNPGSLWIYGRCAYGAPGYLPWTTLRVAHRAPLRPQAPQTPTNHFYTAIRRYKANSAAVRSTEAIHLFRRAVPKANSAAVRSTEGKSI